LVSQAVEATMLRTRPAASRSQAAGGKLTRAPTERQPSSLSPSSGTKQAMLDSSQMPSSSTCNATFSATPPLGRWIEQLVSGSVT
jgi:hypothetical protein